MVQKKPKVFSTDNFCLAIFLRTKMCNQLHVVKKNPRRAFFGFEDTPEVQRLIKEFWERKGAVEPRAFFNNQRELKTLLYDKSYTSDFSSKNQGNLDDPSRRGLDRYE